MDYGYIIKRAIDNSYVINNGMYHVPTVQSFLNEGATQEEAEAKYQEFAELWESVNTYAIANPDKVTIEPAPDPN